VMRAIGRELRVMYGDIIAEGVPEQFANPAEAGRAGPRGEDPMTLVLRKQRAHLCPRGISILQHAPSDGNVKSTVPPSS
jgi:hypothetical protein